jgi:hypothetical protein
MKAITFKVSSSAQAERAALKMLKAGIPVYPANSDPMPKHFGWGINRVVCCDEPMDGTPVDTLDEFIRVTSESIPWVSPTDAERLMMEVSINDLLSRTGVTKSKKK